MLLLNEVWRKRFVKGVHFWQRVRQQRPKHWKGSWSAFLWSLWCFAFGGPYDFSCWLHMDRIMKIIILMIGFFFYRVLETMHQDLPIFSSSVFLLKNALETADHRYNIVQFVSLRKVMVLAHQMCLVILSTNHFSTQTVNSSVHHRSLKSICQFEKWVNVWVFYGAAEWFHPKRMTTINNNNNNINNNDDNDRCLKES